MVWTPDTRKDYARDRRGYACRAADMPPEVAIHMLKSFNQHDPLK